MEEQIRKNRLKTIGNIHRIILAEIDECMGNFVDGNCNFAGFSMGDMFFTNADTGEIFSDTLGLFLLGGQNMHMMSIIMKIKGDKDKMKRVLEIAMEGET